MKDEYDKSVYMLPYLTADEMYDKKNSYVYFMFSAYGDVLLYVGQTTNLRQRIAEHLKSLDDMAELLDDDSLREVKLKAIKVEKEDLNEVEKFYIKKYLPPRNKNHNSKEAIRAYELWYCEKLLAAYNKQRAYNSESPLSFDEAYGGKMKFVG